MSSMRFLIIGSAVMAVAVLILAAFVPSKGMTTGQVVYVGGAVPVTGSPSEIDKRTDQNGRFQVTLKPGTWQVVPPDSREIHMDGDTEFEAGARNLQIRANCTVC